MTECYQRGTYERATAMSDLLDKLSSYNIFNNLLPGTLFAVIGDVFTSYLFIQKDILVAVFAYYFMGLVISRIGSLMIEPTLKKVGFLKFADYSKFVVASKTDKKLDVLSETNNMCRTLCALFVVLFALVAFDRIGVLWSPLQIAGPYIGALGLLVMFLFAYQKQTNYIVKRVDAASEKQE